MRVMTSVTVALSLAVIALTAPFAHAQRDAKLPAPSGRGTTTDVGWWGVFVGTFCDQAGQETVNVACDFADVFADNLKRVGKATCKVIKAVGEFCKDVGGAVKDAVEIPAPPSGALLSAVRRISSALQGRLAAAARRAPMRGAVRPVTTQRLVPQKAIAPALKVGPTLLVPQLGKSPALR